MSTSQKLNGFARQALAILVGCWFVMQSADVAKYSGLFGDVMRHALRLGLCVAVMTLLTTFAVRASVPRRVMIALGVGAVVAVLEFVINLTKHIGSLQGTPLVGADGPMTEFARKSLTVGWAMSLSLMVFWLLQSIKETNESLETRVGERTLELEMANRQLLHEVAERDQAERALRTAHDDLDRRVAQRTIDLSQVNRQLQSEIEEREKMARALCESEEKTRAILDSVPDFIMTVDRQGIIRYINRTIPGLTVEQVVGSNVDEYVSAEAAQAIRQALEAVFEKREIQEFQVRGPVGNGEQGWYACRFAPIHGDSGPPLAVHVATDISQIRDAEERLRQQREQLAHIARLSTMGEMAATLAHEISQPLSAIANYAFLSAEHMEQEGAENRAQAADMLKRIMDSAIRAGEIVRRVRSFVTKRTPSRSLADINAVIREVVELLEPEARLAQIRFEFILDESVPRVMFDVVQIQQVLVNLLRNAFDATVTRPEDSRLVHVMTRTNLSRSIEIEIRDSGSGLPAIDVERLFENFFTTKPDGMGMGLKISRSIIKAHKGILVGRANANGGSTFGFTLPILAGKADLHEPAAADRLHC